MGAGRKPVCVLGISGGSGSGKSWLAAYLKKRLGRAAAVMSQDWYYRDHAGLDSARARRLNFDRPDAIEMPLLVRDLASLHRGEAIETPRYDYAAHSRLPQRHRLEPARVVILEGLFTLTDRTLREQLDASIYIDVPADVRLLRRVRRDIDRRRVPAGETLRLYEHCVRPMHLEHIEPSQVHATWIWSQLDDRHFPRFMHLELKRRLRSGTRPPR